MGRKSHGEWDGYQKDTMINSIWDSDRMNELFLKCLLDCNAEFKFVNSVHLKTFLNEMNAALKIPSADDLTETIFPQACRNLDVEARKQKWLTFIYIQTITDTNRAYVITIALSEKNGFYIHLSMIRNLTKQTLIDFCDSSVLKFLEVHNVRTKLVLHTTTATLAETWYLNENDFRYDIIPCLTLLLCKLEHESFKQPNENLISTGCAMWEAIAELLKILQDENVDIDQLSRDSVKIFLRPVHNFCLFFNNNYKDKLFDQEVKSKIFAYFTQTLPDAAFAPLGYYKENIKYSSEMTKSNKKLDPKHFWYEFQMNVECIPIRQFAIDLLNLPAISKRHDKSRIQIILDDYENEEEKLC